MCSYGTLHMANQKQDDQLEHSYSSYVMIRDGTPKTCRRRWMIGRRGERGSGISVLAARHDDDDEIQIHTGEQPYFHLTGHNCISTKAARTLCFSLIFIPVLLWILNCLFLNVRCCHIPFVLRACEICVVFVVGIKPESNTRKIRTGTHSLQIGE